MCAWRGSSRPWSLVSRAWRRTARLTSSLTWEFHLWRGTSWANRWTTWRKGPVWNITVSWSFFAERTKCASVCCAPRPSTNTTRRCLLRKNGIRKKYTASPVQGAAQLFFFFFSSVELYSDQGSTSENADWWQVWKDPGISTTCSNQQSKHPNREIGFNLFKSEH